MAKATWVLDPAHTTAEFSVRHMMFTTVKGYFTKLEGQIVADLADLTTAEISATIDAASVDTRDAQRDGHLRSADFFDVENHPKLTFQSYRIEKTGENEYDLVGDLTIRGVTKSVIWSLTMDGYGKNPWGQEVAGFTAQTKVNRKDFGLHWNAALEAGGWLVGDEVKFTLHAEAVKQA